VADQAVLGQWPLVLAGLGALLAFLIGAMSTAWLVNWGLRQRLHSAFGLPLILEAAALLLFGLFGATMSQHDALFLPLTVVLLCYTMGLQNAVITKISKAEIRTTHVTGLVTDLGIELGKLLYVNRRPSFEPVRASRDKLRLQLALIGAFLGGGLLGALGFKQWGYLTTVPLAAMLLVLVWRPLLLDLLHRRKQPGG
jgi:uncharacterized membrane protein YoaK (UPF0700 family)